LLKFFNKGALTAGVFLFIFVIVGSVWYFSDTSDDLGAEPATTKPETASQIHNFEEITGKIVFQSDRDGDEEIYVMNAQGREVIQLTNNNAFDGYPVWSKDGKRICFESNRDGSFQIFIMDHEGNNQVKVTGGSFYNRYPGWSPDEKMIAYQSKRDNGLEIYVMDLEKKTEMILTDAWYRSGLPNWAPNGKKIAFTANKILGWGVYVMDRNGSNIKALDTEGGACRPHWSKDGKMIAYVSQKADKKGDIWIMNGDGSGKRQLTTDSINYDYYPSWSRDGNWIAYANTSHKNKGNWEIRIINVINGQSKQITWHPAQDKFPDWY
jgi:TolB protein